MIKAKDAFGNPDLHPLKKMKRTRVPRGRQAHGGREARRRERRQGEDERHPPDREGPGDDVEVRLVHPLAEKDIKYSVEVVQVSDPRPPPMPAEALELEEES